MKIIPVLLTFLFWLYKGNLYSINKVDHYPPQSSVADSSHHADSLHYWTLKPGLDPHAESIRLNASNYVDNGPAQPMQATDPCSTGYEELCCICLEPDSSNPKRPNFNSSVNTDVYDALKKNHFLLNKVFYRDL